jgi:hypothetical protein
MPINPTSRLAFLDISDMYTNIPVGQTKIILNKILQKKFLSDTMGYEVLTFYDTITK